MKNFLVILPICLFFIKEIRKKYFVIFKIYIFLHFTCIIEVTGGLAVIKAACSGSVRRQFLQTDRRHCCGSNVRHSLRVEASLVGLLGKDVRLIPREEKMISQKEKSPFSNVLMYVCSNLLLFHLRNALQCLNYIWYMSCTNHGDS